MSTDKPFNRGMSMPPGGFWDQERIDEAHILPLFMRPEHEITAYIESKMKSLSQCIKEVPDSPRGREFLAQLAAYETSEFFLPNTVNSYHTHPSENPDLERSKKGKESGTGLDAAETETQDR